ncbi:MAG: LON peptidase substrate-binding domain-containing protein, partial [Lachnospiraceae bacterium]|nr:LON peptidase substrate-binding domain-containing protein [Lachnospiraceae bacterium]
MGELEMKLPAVALRGMVILPEMITHFDVTRVRSVKAVERALTQEQRLFITAQKDPEDETPDMDRLFLTGTVAEIKQIVKMPHHILRVLVEGLYSAKLTHLDGEEYL